MEKTKMANFNEKVNRGIGYSLNSQEFFIYRSGTIKEFARMIHDDLYLLTNTYRLFIQYKTTHRVKKVAGRCFLWDNSHGDHMLDPGNGIELRNMKDASQDNCEGFGNPRFNELVSGGRYDMVLLCKKALGNKSPRYDRIICRWDSSDE